MTITPLGSVSGYLARPSGSGPWSGLIVIHEWWGLDDQTISIADRLAELGYIAFAPDLFHGHRASLGDVEMASSLIDRYGPAAPSELETVFDALGSHPDCNGLIGSVGFCFGGRMSLALGLRRRLKAVCTFYGGRMHLLFDELHRLEAPVLGLFGERDQSIPKGTVQEFGRILDSLGIAHEIVVYPDCGHAFFRDTDPSVYHPAAAQDAWERTRAFFALHLGPGAVKPAS